MKWLGLGLVGCSVLNVAMAFHAYGPVQQGQTLWRIAQSHAVAQVPTAKQVKAIFRLNPQAFGNDSMGSLKVGATLWVPSTEQEVHEALIGQAKLPAHFPKTVTSSAAQESKQVTPSRGKEVSKVKPSARSASEAKAKPSSAPEHETSMRQVVIAQEYDQKLQDLQQQNNSLRQKLTATEQQLLAFQQSKETQQVQNNAQVNSGTDAHSSSGWAWVWLVLFLVTFGGVVYYRYQYIRALRARLPSVAARRLGVGGAPRSMAMDDYARMDHGGGKFDQAASGQQVKHGKIFAEVTVAIAEGQFEKAEKMLLNAIRQEKMSLSLRMKLLELYTKMDNKAAFDRHAEQLLKKGLTTEDSETWQRVRQMYINTWVYDD